MSAGYVVGRISVLDAAKWDEYRSRVPATLAPWNGELVFRGELASALIGEEAHSDIVVIRFADVASAQAWFSSPAYQALTPLREQAARVVLSIYRG